MRISRIEAIPVAMPMRTPLKMAVATVSQRECLIVRLSTDDGVVGLGEAVLAPYFSGESPLAGIDLIERQLAPVLLGEDPFNIEALMGRLTRLAPFSPATRAAIEIALHDVVARALGIPLYRLLGGRCRETVPTIWHLSNGEPEADAEEAAAAVARGFKLIKLKVGTQPPDRELASVFAVREAIGPDADLVLDANQGWAPDTAIQFIRQAEAARLLFVEQPVKRNDLLGMAQVAQAVATAIAADEGISTVEDLYLHLRHGAIDAVVPKVIKAGGIGGVRRVAALADGANIAIHLAGMPGETSIGAAAEIHLATALPNLRFGTGISPHYVTDDVVTEPIRPVDGVFRVTETPGLGVDLDPAALERLRIDHARAAVQA